MRSLTESRITRLVLLGALIGPMLLVGAAFSFQSTAPSPTPGKKPASGHLHWTADTGG